MRSHEHDDIMGLGLRKPKVATGVRLMSGAERCGLSPDYANGDAASDSQLSTLLSGEYSSTSKEVRDQYHGLKTVVDSLQAEPAALILL